MSLQTVLLRDDPHVDWSEDVMEFRLTYEGLLLADTNRNSTVRRSRADHKHEIRQKLHSQIKRWWEISPYLSTPHRGGIRILGHPYPQHYATEIAQRYNMFGYNFVPLVTRDLELLCSVEVLFLRLGEPGNLINRSGDVDNRLKTLFDGLRMPRNATELGRYVEPNVDENPFFCLLEDDSVITKASVETDALLQPVSAPPDSNDARLVITVRIRPGRVKAENLGFAS